ncbi:MAG: cyclic nucleotide-binding domain-containing protein [Acidobacteria bacterium]|nr:MAG: cyclic nucleotide-binding domain-containing protein [Acidobacteriota bacterium]REK07307.1 MAG: cyclic nucleotide-binding domain-containing protein [Acidobacteriota bacterium]
MQTTDRTLEAPQAVRGVEMARIEIVLHLQNVSLFRYCAAEEIVRLAGIASPAELAAGETLYRRDDPPRSLYCLVTGEVELSGPEAAAELRGPGSSFGVLDILSGRRRQRTARALRDVTVLAIAAEDFFDLLANNIEIVKALFRQVLDNKESR